MHTTSPLPVLHAYDALKAQPVRGYDEPYCADYTYDNNGNTLEERVVTHDNNENETALALWWTFDGDAATDLSDNSNDGTASGSPGWTDGGVGRAVVLDGTDDKIVKSFTSTTKAAFTVSLWARSSSPNQQQHKGVFSGFGSTANGFQIEADGAGGYRLWDGTSNPLFGSIADSWVHLVLTHDGTTARLYYNGSLATTATGVPTTFNQYAVGVNRNGTRLFDGQVSAVQVYDRALSGTEVLALKTAQADTVSTKTMTYDNFNRQTGWTDGTNSETTAYRGAEWHRKSTTTAAGTTTYLYDGDNVVADLTGGSYQNHYVTPFLDQNLSMTDVSDPQNPATYYYTQDGLGSVRHLTSTAGAVVNQYDYTAFGETYAANNTTTVDQRYTYTGREASSVGAPMYYRTRPFSPQLGRMLNRSPWGYIQGRMSLYDAMANNPVLFVEPFSTVTRTDSSAGAIPATGSAHNVPSLDYLYPPSPPVDEVSKIEKKLAEDETYKEFREISQAWPTNSATKDNCCKYIDAIADLRKYTKDSIEALIDVYRWQKLEKGGSAEQLNKAHIERLKEIGYNPVVAGTTGGEEGGANAEGLGNLDSMSSGEHMLIGLTMTHEGQHLYDRSYLTDAQIKSANWALWSEVRAHWLEISLLDSFITICDEKYNIKPSETEAK